MNRWVYTLILIFPLISLSKGSDKKIPPMTSVANIVIQNGTFKPDVVAINNKKSATLNFFMKDNELCKEKIVIRNLGVEVPISLNTTASVTLKGNKPGRYHIECETGAFCGVLFVTTDEKNSTEPYYVPHPE